MSFWTNPTQSFSQFIGTDSGSAGTAKAVSDLGSSANQALSDFDKTVGISAVSREATQFSKDIGLTGAVKEVSDVVHGIGKAAEKDPLQYAAIIACIAAAPATGGASLKIIPYIQATAKVTSKETSVEDMLLMAYVDARKTKFHFCKLFLVVPFLCVKKLLRRFQQNGFSFAKW